MITSTNLAEELRKLLPLCILGGDGQTGLLESLTEEVADIFPGRSECRSLLVLGRLALEGAGQHVGEKLQRYWEQ